MVRVRPDIVFVEGCVPLVVGYKKLEEFHCVFLTLDHVFG